MSGVTYRVIGLESLLAKLDATRMIARPVSDFFASATGRVQNRAYRNAAKATGAMANAIHSVFDTAVVMSFAQVVAPVAHSPYQELGTWKMAAHPFMRPALEQSAGEITGPLLAQLASSIERGMAL